MSAVDDVVARWKRVVPDEDAAPGVDNPGVSEAALDAFEARHGIALPAAFRALYALSDGTAEMDGHEQIFWPLAAIDSVLASFDVGDPAAHWIGFADFRLQQCVLYLRIAREGASTTVWLDPVIGGAFPARARRLHETFDAFLTAYAASPLFWQSDAPEPKTRQE